MSCIYKFVNSIIYTLICCFDEASGKTLFKISDQLLISCHKLRDGV